MDEIDWIDSTEFPDVLSAANNGNSVDVLIHNTVADEHTVGWFNFNQMRWLFLSNESIKKFKWRYFIDKYYRYDKKKSRTKGN